MALRRNQPAAGAAAPSQPAAGAAAPAAQPQPQVTPGASAQEVLEAQLKKQAEADAKAQAEAAAPSQPAAGAAAPAAQAQAEAQAAAQPQAELVEPEPQVQASVPVAQPRAGAVGTKVISARDVMNSALYHDLENLFVAKFGTLPRLMASNGNIMDAKNLNLGTWITGQVLSWNKRWTITPADKKAPASLCAFSLDGVTLDDGSGVLIADYIAELKKQNYPDACAKEYYDVIFNLHSAEKDQTHVGSMVQMQMSPTSVTEFDSFRLQGAFKIANGLLHINDTLVIRFGVEIASSDGNVWTKFKPEIIKA